MTFSQMKPNHQIVYWNEDIIGHIEDAKIDGVRLYGRWQPTQSDAYSAFQQFLSTDPEPPELRIGDPFIIGHLGIIDDEEIEICLS